MVLSPVVFSEDENEVVLGGHRYKAVPNDTGKCMNCVFKLKFGCDLADAVYRQNGSGDAHGSRCIDYTREDGKGVIWVLAATR